MAHPRALPERCIRRNEVIYNPDLTLRARILYYLIDDKANEDGEMWWHWRKFALLLGVGHSQFFEAVRELKTAGLLTTRKEGIRIYYKLQVFRKTGTAIPENRNEAAPHLITETVQETVPLKSPKGGREEFPTCPTCKGRGHRRGAFPGSCPHPNCQGRGFLVEFVA